MSRGLEEQPLDERVLLLLIGNRKSLLRVVLVREVEKNGVGLPEDEVPIVMVNQGGDTAVRVVLGVFRSLLLVLAKVEVDRLVRESKLFENVDDLPVSAA